MEHCAEEQQDEDRRSAGLDDRRLAVALQVPALADQFPFAAGERVRERSLELQQSTELRLAELMVHRVRLRSGLFRLRFTLDTSRPLTPCFAASRLKSSRLSVPYSPVLASRPGWRSDTARRVAVAGAVSR